MINRTIIQCQYHPPISSRTNYKTSRWFIKIFQWYPFQTHQNRPTRLLHGLHPLQPWQQIGGRFTPWIHKATLHTLEAYSGKLGAYITSTCFW